MEFMIVMFLMLAVAGLGMCGLMFMAKMAVVIWEIWLESAPR